MSNKTPNDETSAHDPDEFDKARLLLVLKKGAAAATTEDAMVAIRQVYGNRLDLLLSDLAYWGQPSSDDFDGETIDPSVAEEMSSTKVWPPRVRGQKREREGEEEEEEEDQDMIRPSKAIKTKESDSSPGGNVGITEGILKGLRSAYRWIARRGANRANPTAQPQPPSQPTPSVLANLANAVVRMHNLQNAHVAPGPQATKKRIHELRESRSDVNVFIDFLFALLPFSTFKDGENALKLEKVWDEIYTSTPEEAEQKPRPSLVAPTTREAGGKNYPFIQHISNEPGRVPRFIVPCIKLKPVDPSDDPMNLDLGNKSLVSLIGLSAIDESILTTKSSSSEGVVDIRSHVYASTWQTMMVKPDFGSDILTRFYMYRVDPSVEDTKREKGAFWRTVIMSRDQNDNDPLMDVHRVMDNKDARDKAKEKVALDTDKRVEFLKEPSDKDVVGLDGITKDLFGLIYFEDGGDSHSEFISPDMFNISQTLNGEMLVAAIQETRKRPPIRKALDNKKAKDVLHQPGFYGSGVEAIQQRLTIPSQLDTSLAVMMAYGIYCSNWNVTLEFQKEEIQRVFKDARVAQISVALSGLSRDPQYRFIEGVMKQFDSAGTEVAGKDTLGKMVKQPLYRYMIANPDIYNKYRRSTAILLYFPQEEFVVSHFAEDLNEEFDIILSPRSNSRSGRNLTNKDLVRAISKSLQTVEDWIFNSDLEDSIFYARSPQFKARRDHFATSEQKSADEDQYRQLLSKMEERTLSWVVCLDAVSENCLHSGFVRSRSLWKPPGDLVSPNFVNVTFIGEGAEVNMPELMDRKVPEGGKSEIQVHGIGAVISMDLFALMEMAKAGYISRDNIEADQDHFTRYANQMLNAYESVHFRRLTKWPSPKTPLPVCLRWNRDKVAAAAARSERGDEMDIEKPPVSTSNQKQPPQPISKGLQEALEIAQENGLFTVPHLRDLPPEAGDGERLRRRGTRKVTSIAVTAATADDNMDVDTAQVTNTTSTTTSISELDQLIELQEDILGIDVPALKESARLVSFHSHLSNWEERLKQNWQARERAYKLEIETLKETLSKLKARASLLTPTEQELPP